MSDAQNLNAQDSAAQISEAALQLVAQLQKAGVSESSIKLIGSQNLSAEDIADSSADELQEIGCTLGDAKKMKRLFPGAASSSSASQTLKVEVAAAATADVAPVTQAAPNAFAHLLNNASAIGVGADALKANIKPAYIEAAADGVLAFVLAGTGAFEVFENDSLWGSLEDLDLRTRIDEWLESVRQGRYISAQTTKQAYEGISALFGTKFEQMITTAAALASQQQMLAQFGSQARIQVDGTSQTNSQLFTLLPLAAEEISLRMQASRLPEASRRLTKQAQDLMQIIRDPRLAQATGVSAGSPDEVAVKFLERQIGPAFVNRFRLALAYERLVRALAACPAIVTLDYITVLGQLAGDVSTLFTLVDPNASSARQGAYQGSNPGQVSPQGAAPGGVKFKFAFNFSMSLKIQG